MARTRGVVAPITANWQAMPVGRSRESAPRLSPAAVDEHWRPLSQSWVASGPSPDFQAGWARVTWDRNTLYYDVIFLSDRPRNRARTLNERTWELGEVCEIFLKVSDQPNYLELHVTPENQRLQLRWPPDGLERLRRDQSPLADFMIYQEDWMQSTTKVGPGFWVAQMTLSASNLGLNELSPTSALVTAVCRYDYGIASAPVLSSTAPLTEPSYHRWHEWSPLVLCDSGINSGA